MNEPTVWRALRMPLIFFGGAVAVLVAGGVLLMRGNAPAPEPMPAPAKAQAAPIAEMQSSEAVAEILGDPYPLAICAVSGEKLGTMGDPLIETIDGREIRFCCADCVGKFKGARGEYLAKIDAALVEQQKPYYPLATDVVTSAPLGDKAIDHVFRNRLVRLADADSLAKFTAEPALYIKQLDASVVAAQKDAYPLKHCLVVQADAIGEGGMIPVDLVFANRLVRFCCAGCEPKFRADPLTYMQRLDEAIAAQKPKP